MTLIVPEYVLAQQQAKKQAEKAAKEKSLKDRMPQPTGWRILVMPYMGKDKTDGGVVSAHLLIRIWINLENTGLGVRKEIGFVSVDMLDLALTLKEEKSVSLTMTRSSQPSLILTMLKAMEHSNGRSSRENNRFSR